MTELSLKGVRVLDMGQVVSMPYCGQMLGWMGADVILVETPRRTTARLTPPFAYGREGFNTSGLFNLLNTNKSSCTINLTKAKGINLIKELVRVSDVVMENFATRTMPKFGLNYDELCKVKSDIIMISLSALGRTGPMKNYVGMHSSANLFSGVATVTGYGPEDRPRLLGSVLPDTLAGEAAFLAILQALYYRQRTGRGQFIDICMSEVFTNLIPQIVAEYSVTGSHQSPIGNRDEYKVPHGVYRCQGADYWVAISIGSEEEWRAMCKVMGQPGLATDPRFADADTRWRHQDELDAIITKWTRQRTDYEAMHTLQRAGVPAGASLNVKGLLNDPHMRSRKYVIRPDHPEAGRRRMLGAPWKISGLPPIEYRSAPGIGEHTDEVMIELLGLGQREVQQLREEEVLL